jgi:hypothetical protein
LLFLLLFRQKMATEQVIFHLQSTVKLGYNELGYNKLGYKHSVIMNKNINLFIWLVQVIFRMILPGCNKLIISN